MEAGYQSMREHPPFDDTSDPAAPGRFGGERRPTIPPLVGAPFPTGRPHPPRPHGEFPSPRLTAPTPPSPQRVSQASNAADAQTDRNGGQDVGGAGCAGARERGNAGQETPQTLRGAWTPALAQEAHKAASNQRMTDPPLYANADAPTNIYYLAQYVYQLSLTAASMDDQELGLLLPRSGRVWFNVKLFNDAPNGRDLAQRDAWWRVVDASPAVRFLLGWCVAVYRTAQFDRAPRETLPGRGRVMYFSPPESAPSALRIQFWSDIARDVTEMFAPSARIWRQLQAFTPMQIGEPRWAARLTYAGHDPDETLTYLADRNNCAISLIRRALQGNPAFSTYNDYRRFTEVILNDLPRLRMQRVIAMQSAGFAPANVSSREREQTPLRGARATGAPNRWAATMEDPRQNIHFWQLHI